MATKRRQRTRKRPLSLGELLERLAPLWAPRAKPGERPVPEVLGRPADMVLLEACRIARRDGPQALEAWLQDLAARLPADLGAEERAKYTAFFEQLATPDGRARLIETSLNGWTALACEGAKVSGSPVLKELVAFVEYFHAGRDVPLDFAAGMLALVLLWFRLGEFAAVIRTHGKLATAFVQAEKAAEGGRERRRRGRGGPGLRRAGARIGRGPGAGPAAKAAEELGQPAQLAVRCGIEQRLEQRDRRLAA